MSRSFPHALVLCVAISVSVSFGASNDAGDVARTIDAKHTTYAQIARQIWEFAEVGYQEEKSSQLLRSHLRSEGFQIEAGVAEMPTAFVATYGSGKPVVAILAEFDALPGLSQDAVAVRKPVQELAPGHGCGHHLFGTASTAAAVAVKNWLKSSGRGGTIRLYGTPAEEGGAGKVYMVRAGLFSDVDIVLHWHPSDRNDASPQTSLANRSAKFRFHGYSAHAAGAPERGRSALDGVEAMNHMINLLREHVPSDTRIHYVITRGGGAPNVVPDFAEVYYYVRNPSAKVLEGIWERVVKAAEGAALGTGTRLEFEIIHGLHSLLPNEAIAKRMYANLQLVGGIQYSDEELAFAKKIRETLGPSDLELGSETTIQPFETKMTKGSTDVGDVSWVVSTAGLGTATWVPGTSAHSWQAVAAGGMGIGFKGMAVAAKTLAMTAVDVFSDPNLAKAAKQELIERRGLDFKYHSLLGDRKPPLDYRK
ncbi:amidohydrolase [bacterium]|nr:amidohydrolase [bacterium]